MQLAMQLDARMQMREIILKCYSWLRRAVGNRRWIPMVRKRRKEGKKNRLEFTCPSDKSFFIKSKQVDVKFGRGVTLCVPINAVGMLDIDRGGF